MNNTRQYSYNLDKVSNKQWLKLRRNVIRYLLRELRKNLSCSKIRVGDESSTFCKQIFGGHTWQSSRLTVGSAHRDHVCGDPYEPGPTTCKASCFTSHYLSAHLPLQLSLLILDHRGYMV